MSFFVYYKPSVASFMEQDSDRLATDIVRHLIKPNPLTVLLRREEEAQAIRKKSKRWKKKLRKARRMVAKLNNQAAQRRTVIKSKISERYADAKPYTKEQLTLR